MTDFFRSWIATNEHHEAACKSLLCRCYLFVECLHAHMTLMCVLVPCHDLLTHAAGLIVNHHLVLLWLGEGGDG